MGCVAGAVVVGLLGVSRGNWRAALVGAVLFLGYAVMHSVARRLTPAARVITGHEADDRERLAQFRATRLAGQVALATAAVGVALALFNGWDTGLWVAGAVLLVVVAFVLGLWLHGRSRA